MWRDARLLLPTFLFFLSVSLVPAAPAAAEDASELAQKAQRLMREGDYTLAMEALGAAIDLDPDNPIYRFQAAGIFASQGQFEAALPHFQAVVRLQPDNAAARRGEATALLLMERWSEARTRLEESLEAVPRDGALAHTLARVLASAPITDVRDGKLALQLATTVFEAKKTFDTGETVAMAYAEAGFFDDAVAMQRSLIEAVEKDESEGDRLEPMRERLVVFLRKEAWRAPSPLEIVLATDPPKLGG